MTILADKATVVTDTAGSIGFATVQLLAREGTRGVPVAHAVADLSPLTLPFRKAKDAPMTMLTDKVAIVTGAAGAIGFAIAQRLAREGTGAAFQLPTPSPIYSH